MEKRLATGVSEYAWDIGKYSPSALSGYSLNVTDPRDGEVIIMTVWPRPEITYDESKALLNIFLSAFYKGARHGAEKKAREIRLAIGLEIE